MLRELGIHGERVAAGYTFLTDVVREHIHQLAFDYRVLSLEDGVRRCRSLSRGKRSVAATAVGRMYVCMYVGSSAITRSRTEGELMNKTASNARLKASLEELAQLGSPVDLSVAVTEVENEKVEIEQVGGINESHLFELQDGRVACMADIAVTNQTVKNHRRGRRRAAGDLG